MMADVTEGELHCEDEVLKGGFGEVPAAVMCDPDLPAGGKLMFGFLLRVLAEFGLGPTGDPLESAP